MADQISLSLSALRDSGNTLSSLSTEMADLGSRINKEIQTVLGSGWQGEKKNEYEVGWDAQKNTVMVKIPELLNSFSKVLLEDANAFEATDNS